MESVYEAAVQRAIDRTGHSAQLTPGEAVELAAAVAEELCCEVEAQEPTAVQTIALLDQAANEIGNFRD